MQDTMNVLEAAVLAHVPVRDIYAAIDSGELAAHDIQRRVRLLVSDVEHWRDHHA